MTTHLPKDVVTYALGEEFATLHELLSDLEEAEWSAPTPCPGWDVRAQVAHVIGTESMLAGIDAPVVEGDPGEADHVRNDIGAFNERWVAALADASPLDLLVFADAMPPATFDLGLWGWVPTLELTVHVRGLAAPGWLRVVQRATVLRDGWVDEECLLWDSTDHLVAQARQLAGYRLPE